MNIAQKFNDALQVRLEQEYYPTAALSKRWQVYALKALVTASPISLGIKAEDFKKLYEQLRREAPLTMYQFAVLSNNLEAKSAKDLRMSMRGYLDLIVEANGYSKTWNDMTALLREEVTKQIAEEAAAEKEKSKLNGKAIQMQVKPKEQ